VPLDASLVSALKAHRRHQLEERMRAGAAYTDEGYVACDELGRPYHPDTFGAIFEQLVSQSGLPRRRLHDMRHTAITVMAHAGVAAWVCARIVGHSSTRMIDAVYRHELHGETDVAGEAISKVLLG
jgi:integrase